MRAPSKKFIVQKFALLSLIALIAACTGGTTKPWLDQSGGANRPAQQSPSDLTIMGVDRETLTAPNNATPSNPTGQPVTKVAILLPLTGQHAKLGQAMLNASQIALFDLGYEQFELLPKDTLGTAEGAREAAIAAMKDGAQMVLGPLFAPSVREAQSVLQGTKVPMIPFSTDWTLANRNTFLIGFLPFDQVERVTRFAVAKGYTRQGVLSPQTSYGDGVVSAYQAISRSAGVETFRIERFNLDGKNLAGIMSVFSNYDARKKHQEQQKLGFALNGTDKPPFDAVLMPVGGALARQVGSFLNHYDMPPQQVKRLSTGVIDDPAIANDRSLEGTWFAAPSPRALQKFEDRYTGVYKSPPPRIASLAYDATALAAILARMGIQKDGRPAYDHASLTNPNGFAGVDGIFRFRPNGISERGLAILEFRNGRIVEIDPAPKTFEQQGY